MSQPKVVNVNFTGKELLMQDEAEKVRQTIMRELEEGWPSLTLYDWCAIRASIASATSRGVSGPLPEELKLELFSQIKNHGSCLTKRDLQEMRDQIEHAKRRENGGLGDIEDALYGTESYVSTR